MALLSAPLRQCGMSSRHAQSFSPVIRSQRAPRRVSCCATSSRRELLASTTGAAGLAALLPLLGVASAAHADQLSAIEPMEGLKGKDYGKTRMTYPDYTTTNSGLQYQDIRVGEGAAPQAGQTVVVDWAGYTIGYYGRPFEARNKPKGSSFTGDDKDFYRFQIGSGQVIPAWEEAIAGMKVGGIRRIIVAPELGYPANPKSGLPDFNLGVGPKPTNFAGSRALGFVLENRGMIDKTLLYDIELLKVL